MCQADKCMGAQLAGSEGVAPMWVLGEDVRGSVAEMYMHMFAYIQRLSFRESTRGGGAGEEG